MENVYLNGRLWRVSVTESRGGLLLIGDARELDQVRVGPGLVVEFERQRQVATATVTAALRCPAGEPEAWVWLTVTSPAMASRRVPESVAGAVRKARSRW